MNLPVRATCVVVPLELFVFNIFFALSTLVVLLECITASSNTSLKSKVDFIDKKEDITLL